MEDQRLLVRVFVAFQNNHDFFYVLEAKMKVLNGVLLSILLVGCNSEQIVESSVVQLRNDLHYLPNTDSPFSGRVQDLFEDGQLKLDYTVSDGKIDGSYMQWYENGQLKSEIGYVDGVLHGQTKRWQSNGVLRSDESFENGRYQGRTKYYDDSGNPILDINVVNGLLDGSEIFLNYDNTKSTETYSEGRSVSGTREFKGLEGNTFRTTTDATSFKIETFNSDGDLLESNSEEITEQDTSETHVSSPELFQMQIEKINEGMVWERTLFDGGLIAMIEFFSTSSGNRWNAKYFKEGKLDREESYSLSNEGTLMSVSFYREEAPDGEYRCLMDEDGRLNIPLLIILDEALAAKCLELYTASSE